jgi:hypothetical protein
MQEQRFRSRVGLQCLAGICLLIALCFAPGAIAAETPPYEFDAKHSLTGGCGTSKADEVADPGCPEKKPPQPFSRPTAIAIAPSGYEYVASYGTSDGGGGRIDIFDPEGVFVTEISGVPGPKSLAVDDEGNLYVLGFRPLVGAEVEVALYSPSVYKPEEGKVEYGNPRDVFFTYGFPSYGGLAVDQSNGHVLVSHGEEIDVFESAGEENKSLETITHERLFSTALNAVDSQRRRIYVSSCPDKDITKCWVLVFDADAPHELLEEVKGPNPSGSAFLSTKGWISTAVDEGTGDFFVGDLELGKNIYQFNEAYEHISTLALNPESFEGGEPLQTAVSNAVGAFNHHFLFVPSWKNRALAFHPPDVVAPEVESIAAGNIGETEAELQAQVEPHGGTTTYVFEYTTQQSFEEKGFEGATVAGEGVIADNQQEANVFAPITGLQSGTAYRFRIVAENEKGVDEAESGFTTYSDAPIFGECANQALRTAFSAHLPDCRAYELVTPADTNGRPPQGVKNVGEVFMTLEASAEGSAVSFITEGGAIPGIGGTGGFNGDPYRATRGTTGWSTQSAGPDGTETVSPDPGGTSPDQGYSFWTATRGGSAMVGGKDTRYVHYPDGHSELIGRGSLETDPRAQGKWITEGGAHIVFQTSVTGQEAIQLEEDAPPTGTAAVYDRIKNPLAPGGEETKVVSLLPGDVTPAAGQNASYVSASADGEGIAFTIEGTLYLRVGNEETFEAGPGLTFAGVSEGGDRIFYMEGGDLKALDTTAGPPGEEIAFTSLGNVTPVNVSKDGTRAYFVSTTALGDENPNGDLPVGGQRNLYLSEEGAISFVATVTARDVDGELDALSNTLVDGLGLWTIAFQERGRLAKDPSRLNPDGTVMLFQSRANLTGYESKDAEGKEVPQIYRYDHSGDRLHCISCIPTKTPAGEGASLQSFVSTRDPFGPFSSFGFVPNITPDGKRAFFESTEALVAADTDGVKDVYEWEEQGVGSCAIAGGCVYLITSGHSDKNNYLYAMSRSGDDVFFTTGDILVGSDNNTLSIYDARVNGGFAEPSPVPCEEIGECQGPAPAPPQLPAPTSEGLGRLQEAPPPRTCPKGKKKVKRDGKIVCVKKKKKQKKQGKKKAGKAAGKGAGK